jgi:ABC-type Fe3+-hydroxamate transport system substrate-binding protein
VISLVPSVTESLFDLGAGEALVGVTDFCSPPASAAERLQRVGGTKNPHLDIILALKPDLVIANQEENERKAVEALQAAGVKVWLTFPQDIQGAIGVLWTITDLFRLAEAPARIRTLEQALEWTVRASRQRRPVRVFCPIWRGSEGEAAWWMTFNRQSYAHDVLQACGGENVFAGRDRRYPLLADLGKAAAESPAGRDTRYPRVSVEEIKAAAPELILLPSEPYAFGEKDVDLARSELGQVAGAAPRVQQIDGSLLTWHGTRLARALAELPSILQLPVG